MKSLSMFIRYFSIIFLILISYYSSAQTAWNKDMLIKTWKLKNKTLPNGKPYLKMNELQNELMTFKTDSVLVREFDKDKFEGLWYFDAQGFLVIKFTKVNEKQYDLSARFTTLWKIKELKSDHLELIFIEREGHDLIYTYNSYFEN